MAPKELPAQDEVCFVSQFIAQVLKRLRNDRCLSQQDLAKLAGLDRTYISMLERGQRNLTMGTLERLIPHLGKSPAEFFILITEQMASECDSKMAKGTCPNTADRNRPCPTNRSPQKVLESLKNAQK